MELCDSGEVCQNGGASSTGQKPLHVSLRARGGRPRSLQDARIERADASYFDSYGHFDIHRTMLSDKVCAATSSMFPGTSISLKLSSQGREDTNESFQNAD